MGSNSRSEVRSLGSVSVTAQSAVKRREQVFDVLSVHGEQFTWISGEDLVSDYDRCRICGSLAPDHNPHRDLYNIPAGLLDDDTGIEIVDHIFVGSKANWDIIGDDAPQHEEDGPPLI